MDRDIRVRDIEHLAALLARSQLSSEDCTTQLISQYHNERFWQSTFGEPVTSFCAFLVGTGVVTTWQCEKLRNGQWKGFFDFEGYVVLDDLGSQNDFWYFLARSTSEQTIVRLAAKPRGEWQSNKPEFRVDHVFQ